MDEIKEYIDRVAALREWPLCDEPADAYQFIKSFPISDVRPVVLCRDCIHARHYTNKIKCGYWSEQASEIVCEDDFCSHGAKMEEDPFDDNPPMEYFESGGK